MRKQCQSCGMPLKKPEDFGTEKDGSKSEKYCSLCYVDGKFKNPDMTAEEMQEFVANILRKEKHWPKFLASAATKQIPKLERWR